MVAGKENPDKYLQCDYTTIKDTFLNSNHSWRCILDGAIIIWVVVGDFWLILRLFGGLAGLGGIG